MKLPGLMISLLSAVLISAAAEIALSPQLPATDAMWTRAGRQTPSFYPSAGTTANHPASYEIRGDLPFNLFYNVMGTADEFSASVSLAEKPSPDRAVISTPVTLEIRVDRQTVMKQQIFAGRPPVPVKIDLRGKVQLELHVENISPNNRPSQVIWHNPIFVSDTPEQLCTTLKKAASDRDAIFTAQRSYPDAPVWRDLAIKKVVWQNYPDAYRVDNGVLQAVFVPAMGGRIIHLSGPDSNNILCDRQPEDRDPIPLRGRFEDMTGGHFIRLLPQNYFIPTDPVLEQGPYDIEFPTEGVIVMRSPPSPIFWVSYQYRFEFQPHSRQIKVRNSLINVAPFAQQGGIWSLTRLSGGEISQLVIPSPACPLTVQNEKEAMEMVQKNDLLMIRKTEKINLEGAYLKLSCHSPLLRLLAQFHNGCDFRISYQRQSDPAGMLQIFADRFFIELENYGEVRLLRPGDSCVLDETWLLEPPSSNIQ